jgi:hypothetical protein
MIRRSRGRKRSGRRRIGGGAIAGKVFDKRCEVILGRGSNGVVSKQCTDSACTDCYVFKEGRGVTIDDAESSYIAWNMVKNTPFRGHILEFIGFEEIPRGRTADVTTLTTFAPNYGSWREVILTNVLSKDQLAQMLIQTFLTLDFLRETANMYHMDLKLANLLAVPWPTDAKGAFVPEILPATSANVSFRLPGAAVYTKVIDFGNAVFVDDAGKYVGGSDIYEESYWQKKCYIPAFDVFRLLNELWELTYTGQVSVRASTLLQEIISGSFGSITAFEQLAKKHRPAYGMLDEGGCELISRNARRTYKIKTFAQVILNSPTLMSEYAIPGAAALPPPAAAAPPPAPPAAAAAPAAAGAGPPVVPPIVVVPMPIALGPFLPAGAVVVKKAKKGRSKIIKVVRQSRKLSILAKRPKKNKRSTF